MSYRYLHKKGNSFGGGIVITNRAYWVELEKKEKIERKKKKAVKERRTKTRRSSF